MGYIRILIGDIPEKFIYRKRDFYRCLAFTALLVSQNRKYTGYKELNKVGVDPEDLIWLDIISLPTEKGAFSLNVWNAVTYSPLKNPVPYYLDTSAFGQVNVTDVLLTRDSQWLYDLDAWTYYDEKLLTQLDTGMRQWFLKIVSTGRLCCPASELIQRCIIKHQYYMSDEQYEKLCKTNNQLDKMRPKEPEKKITYPKSNSWR